MPQGNTAKHSGSILTAPFKNARGTDIEVSSMVSVNISITIVYKRLLTMPKINQSRLHKIAVLFEIGNIATWCNPKSLTKMPTKMALI